VRGGKGEIRGEVLGVGQFLWGSEMRKGKYVSIGKDH